jgi:ATP-binding cassette, subfamily B, bacterial
LSLERISEIHLKDKEKQANEISTTSLYESSIELKNISFRYPSGSNTVLNELNLLIPHNKITSIVGTSGSGKTTLMKLLLKFYEPMAGEINIGKTNLNSIAPYLWRDLCGVVMQEGYIFSDTIANNIALGFESIDKQRLLQAASISNISEFIDSLPLGYNTRIGMEGLGISTGQKQRILIARAVYKNPKYFFIDEATSALDANNEKVIMNNLKEFFQDRTVVIIAHRLSTVKNSDQIIVLSDGKIIENGNHNNLIKLRGSYYELVKNQLELGN